jgi:hypothetical protein
VCADCVHLSAMARSRAEASTGGSACRCARRWLACAFRRFASLYLQGASLFFGIALSWCAKLGREKRVARTIFDIVIARHKARSAVFLSDDPAIHAECRLAEISRSTWRAARQHGPPAKPVVRKPDTAFRNHAFAGGESFFVVVVVKQNSGA